MKELDIVKLIEDFAGISAGTNGTIVLEYDGTHFEVEFVDAAVEYLPQSCDWTLVAGERNSRDRKCTLGR